MLVNIFSIVALLASPLAVLASPSGTSGVSTPAFVPGLGALNQPTPGTGLSGEDLASCVGGLQGAACIQTPQVPAAPITVPFGAGTSGSSNLPPQAFQQPTPNIQLPPQAFQRPTPNIQGQAQFAGSCPASSVNDYASALREYDEVLSQQMSLIRSITSELTSSPRSQGAEVGRELSGPGVADLAQRWTRLQALNSQLSDYGNTLWSPSCVSSFSGNNMIYQQAVQMLQVLTAMQREAIASCMAESKERETTQRMVQVLRLFTRHAREALQTAACQAQAQYGQKIAEQLGERLRNVGAGSCRMTSSPFPGMVGASAFGGSAFGGGMFGSGMAGSGMHGSGMAGGCGAGMNAGATGNVAPGLFGGY